MVAAETEIQFLIWLRIGIEIGIDMKMKMEMGRWGDENVTGGGWESVAGDCVEQCHCKCNEIKIIKEISLPRNVALHTIFARGVPGRGSGEGGSL